jgi:ribulose-phosphate 3-epimerase
MSIKISPSLASAPTDRLGEAVRSLEKAGTDYIHFDVEDGSFVPVMTLGTKIIADLRPYTQLPFDVHLMMRNPEWILPQLVQDGANRVSVHYEACRYPRRVLRKIVELGASAGLALNPATPVPDLSFLEPYLSFMVILTTEPEGPDCPFLPAVLEKVRLGKTDPVLRSLEWVVDGGVNQENVREVAAAGADTVVVGRGAFENGTIGENINIIRSNAG